MLDAQRLVSGWQNVDMLSGRVSSRHTYYYMALERPVQYEAPVLLLVPAPLIVSYCSGQAASGSADEKILV